MADKSPRVLNDGQRLLFTTIPQELTIQELAEQYTLTKEDFHFIQRFYGDANRLGVALQLCTLRYPGRPLLMMTSIPLQLVEFVASQLDVAPQVYADYAQPRRKTASDHLEVIRERYGYRTYEAEDDVVLSGYLRPLALENDEPLPLVEAACLWMRTHRIIPPTLLNTERVIWYLLRETKMTVYHILSTAVTARQRRQLVDMLSPSDETAGITPLVWLRQPAKQPSPGSMYHLIERVAYLDTLALPERPAEVHPNRFRQLAQRGEQYQPQPLSKLVDDNEQIALLYTQLTIKKQTLIDQLVDMFDRWLLDITRKGKQRQRHHLYRNITTLNRDLNTLTVAMSAFLAAKEAGDDPYEAVFAVVEEERLVATIESAEQTGRPADMDYRDLVEYIYQRRRRAMLAMFRTLSFQAVAESHASLDALNFVLDLMDSGEERVQQYEYTIDGKSVITPLGHLKWKRWKRHACTDEGINPNYYELGAFDRLREALRAGDVTVDGSIRHLSFDSYLLSDDEWERLQQTLTGGLGVPADVHQYLQQCQDKFEAAVKQLKRELETETSPLSVTDAGDLKLTRLKKAVPAGAKALSDYLYRHIPTIDFTQMVIDVDQWTGLLDQFTHLVSGAAPEREQKPILIAALLENGMNIGVSRMALATDFSARELSQSAELHIREQTLQSGLTILDNFVLHHPYSRHWGQGTTSSSDGMRIPVAVKSANAVYNPKYFWHQRGVTLVTHTADIWMPFYPQIIEDTREALYIIDALLHHQTDLNLTEHFTDSAGATYHVFALCRLLGIQFTPRIRDVTQKYLFSVEEVDDMDATIMPLYQGVIEKTRVVKQWDTVRRLAASIRHGTGPASVLMRKLAAYPKNSQIAPALREMGKLERSIFTLNFMQDAVMQRRSLAGLNKGEAVHALANAIRVGQGGELHEAELQAQSQRASGLMLLVAIISTWNTVYLDLVVKTLRAKGEIIPDELLQHVAPLGSRHINFLGRYHFDLNQVFPLTQLRPLMSPNSTFDPKSPNS